MKVGQFYDELAERSAQPEQHILVTDLNTGYKREIRTLWEDEHGVLNIIVEDDHAGKMSDNLRREALGEDDTDTTPQ